MGDGVYWFAGFDCQCNSFNDRQPIYHSDFDEYYFAVCWYIYGSNACGVDFYSIFLPICQEFGMHSVQFGIMVSMNLCIGTITPPVGFILFTGCKVANVKIEQVIKYMIPYFGIILAELLLVTYIPAISMTLPTLAGLIK